MNLRFSDIEIHVVHLIFIYIYIFLFRGLFSIIIFLGRVLGGFLGFSRPATTAAGGGLTKDWWFLQFATVFSGAFSNFYTSLPLPHFCPPLPLGPTLPLSLHI